MLSQVRNSVQYIGFSFANQSHTGMAHFVSVQYIFYMYRAGAKEEDAGTKKETKTKKIERGYKNIGNGIKQSSLREMKNGLTQVL